jgi:TRAP transporter TAXI family solute receptor
MTIVVRLAALALLMLPLAYVPALTATRQRTPPAQQPKSEPKPESKPSSTAQKLGTMQKTTIILGTATPGGGFPLFGDALAAAVNATDPTFQIDTRNTKGSAENIPLLEENKLDIALVAGEPAYEAFAGIGRPITSLKIITAIYSNPGMFVVKGDSSYRTVQSLVGQPIAWGTRDSGLTLLARYVMDGLGLDREKDFKAVYLDKAGDGPAMVLDGRVAALWGGGIGWPGFTAVTQAGGRLIGLSPADAARIRKKHNFLKPLTVPAGTYPNQNELVTSVGSWSFVLARQSLDDELAYRLAKSIHRSYNNLVKRVAQGHETTPQNTVAAAPRVTNIHPGVQKYLREIGIIR